MKRLKGIISSKFACPAKVKGTDSFLAQRDERTINHILHSYFFLNPTAPKFLIDDQWNHFFGDLAVQWKRIAVFIISGRSIGRVHLDMLLHDPHSIILVFQGVFYAFLIGA